MSSQLTGCWQNFVTWPCTQFTTCSFLFPRGQQKEVSPSLSDFCHQPEETALKGLMEEIRPTVIICILKSPDWHFNYILQSTQIIELPGGGNVVEGDRNMFEFHLPQWARDPVKGYEPLLRQQGLRLGKTSCQVISQAYSADGIFLPAKNKGLVLISWKILQCCSRSSLSLFTLLREFTSSLRNVGACCCQVPPGFLGFPRGRSRGPQTPPHT